MAGMLRLEPIVVRLRHRANRVHNVPQQLFSTFAVPKELNGEYLGHAFGLAA